MGDETLEAEHRTLMSPRTPEIQLINRLFALFKDNVACLEAWGIYLFSDEFDREPELRWRIGAIWLASLLDSIEGADRTIDQCEDAAVSLGLPHFPFYCEQARIFVGTIEQLLALYSREEQIFLRAMRDRLVHSWLSAPNNDVITAKWFDGEEKKLVCEPLSWDEYHGIVRPFFESTRAFNGIAFDLPAM